jgi:hypothetical protein
MTGGILQGPYINIVFLKISGESLKRGPLAIHQQALGTSNAAVN